MTTYTDKAIAILTLLGLIYGGYSFIENKFEDYVSLKIAPYQKLIIAQSLNDEKAISAFNEALTGMLEEKVNSDLLTSVIRPYLEAIANSEKPYKYQHHVSMLLDLIEEKTSIDYDMSNSLGWYYFQTNDISKAEHYFLTSISLYTQADLINISGTAYHGLALTYLAKDDMPRAISNYNKAWEYDYNSFNPQSYITNDYRNARWFQRLLIIYPNLSTNYTNLHSYLKKEYKLNTLTAINKQ